MIYGLDCFLIADACATKHKYIVVIQTKELMLVSII